MKRVAFITAVIYVLLVQACLAETTALSSATPTPSPPAKKAKVTIFPFHYVALGAAVLLTAILGVLTTGFLLPNSLKKNRIFDALFYRKLLPTSNNRFLSFIQYNTLAEMTFGEVYIVIAFLGLCGVWFAWGYVHAAATNHNSPIGRGLGWICLLNASFVILPVTRNSIWYKVFGITYERAIKYHRLLSWWNLIIVSLHGIFIIVAYAGEDRLFKIIQWGTNPNDYSKLPGLIAWILFTAGGLVSLEFVRRNFWRVFVISHVILNLTAMVLVVIHAMWHQALPFMGTSMALYAIDLVLRFTIGYLKPAKVTEVKYLEECDTVKLVVRKQGFEYSPGQYVFLWIDAIGLADSHPFTIATHSDPRRQDTVTLYIKNMAHKGYSFGMTRWTERLVEWAKDVQSGKRSMQSAMVCMEGPYGSVSHNYDQYETVVLFAGGIGITAMYSLFTSLIEKYRNDPVGYSNRKVYLVWVKKTNHMWDMFPELLSSEDTDNQRDILDSKNCEVQLYVTGDAEEKRMGQVKGATVNTGRPDIRKILRKIAEERMFDSIERNNEYISVCGCGTTEMMRELEAACWHENNATARFHFHRETFEL